MNDNRLNNDFASSATQCNRAEAVEHNITMEANLSYFKFESIFNASKSKDYKAVVTKNCTVLMNFLVSNDLLNIQPLNSDGHIKEDLILRTSDFKNNGHLLFGKPVMKWFQYLDKGGDVNNLSILEKALEKIKS